VRLKCANWLQRGLPILVLLCFAVALKAQEQDSVNARMVEEDYRLTSVDERQRAVDELRKNADQLSRSGQLVAAART
jgi:hypothetical protein